MWGLPLYSTLLFLNNTYTGHLSHFNLKHPKCQSSLSKSLKNDTSWLRGQVKGSTGNSCWQPAQTTPLFALTVGLTNPTEPLAPQFFCVLRPDALKQSSQAQLSLALACVQTTSVLSDLTKISRFHKILTLALRQMKDKTVEIIKW